MELKLELKVELNTENSDNHFPGGFVGDDRNAFITEGRTEIENDIYNYLQELLRLRKEYPVLSKGKLRHIYPLMKMFMF